MHPISEIGPAANGLEHLGNDLAPTIGPQTEHPSWQPPSETTGAVSPIIKEDAHQAPKREELTASPAKEFRYAQPVKVTDVSGHARTYVAWQPNPDNLGMIQEKAYQDTLKNIPPGQRLMYSAGVLAAFGHGVKEKYWNWVDKKTDGIRNRRIQGIARAAMKTAFFGPYIVGMGSVLAGCINFRPPEHPTPAPTLPGSQPTLEASPQIPTQSITPMPTERPAMTPTPLMPTPTEIQPPAPKWEVVKTPDGKFDWNVPVEKWIHITPDDVYSGRWTAYLRASGLVAPYNPQTVCTYDFAAKRFDNYGLTGTLMAPPTKPCENLDVNVPIKPVAGAIVDFGPEFGSFGEPQLLMSEAGFNPDAVDNLSYVHNLLGNASDFFSNGPKGQKKFAARFQYAGNYASPEYQLNADYSGERQAQVLGVNGLYNPSLVDPLIDQWVADDVPPVGLENVIVAAHQGAW